MRRQESKPLFQFLRVSRLPGNTFIDTQDFLFTSTDGEGRLEFINRQPTSPCFPSDGELLIDVTVNGQSNQFLRGLVSSTFFLLPGKAHGLSFLPKAFSAAEFDRITQSTVQAPERPVEPERDAQRAGQRKPERIAATPVRQFMRNDEPLLTHVQR